MGLKMNYQKSAQGLPDGAVVKTSPSNVEGMGSNPCPGANILQALGQKTENKTKQKQT